MWYGFFLDGKRLLIERPFLASADLGYMIFADFFAPDYEKRVYGIHPTLLFGSDRLYGGIGWNDMRTMETNYPMGGKPYTVRSRESGLRLLIGASWGKRWQFNPELILNFHRHYYSSAPIMAGCGFRGVISLKKEHCRPTLSRQNFSKERLERSPTLKSLCSKR